MYLISDAVIVEPPTVKRNADNGTLRIVFGLQGHLSLSVAEAVHLVTELAAALDEAEGDEVKPLLRDAERIQTDVEIREDRQ